MGRVGWRPNTPRVIRDQPQEGLPSRETKQKIAQLEALRARILVVRKNYRIAPTPTNEAALRRLTSREESLSVDVAFGANPVPEFGRSKMS